MIHSSIFKKETVKKSGFFLEFKKAAEGIVESQSTKLPSGAHLGVH